MSPPRNLHELLSVQRDELIRRVNETVMASITSEAMPHRELEDSLPVFIDLTLEVLKNLAVERHSSPPPEINSLSREHGEHRLRLGFSVEAVTREYNVLRDTVWQMAEEAGMNPTLREVRAVSACVDGATFEAVREYQRQRDEEQERQGAEHLSFLAHELRNPLGSARTAAKLLRGAPFAVEGKVIDVLERSLVRLTGLIDDTLLSRRLKTGAALHREWVDVRGLLLDAQEESAVDAQHRGLQVAVEVEEGFGVEADARLLRSVVSNLLRNAVKFSRPGGGIRLSARRDGKRVVIGVEDACGGLDPATMDRLFDPFVQAHGDRSGFGLGLAIARQAAEAHGGRIEVHSLPGVGCAFLLSLPLSGQP